VAALSRGSPTDRRRGIRRPAAGATAAVACSKVVPTCPASVERSFPGPRIVGHASGFLISITLLSPRLSGNPTRRFITTPTSRLPAGLLQTAQLSRTCAPGNTRPPCRGSQDLQAYLLPSQVATSRIELARTPLTWEAMLATTIRPTVSGRSAAHSYPSGQRSAAGSVPGFAGPVPVRSPQAVCTRGLEQEPPQRRPGHAVI
jgi:hypothetical protein